MYDVIQPEINLIKINEVCVRRSHGYFTFYHPCFPFAVCTFQKIHLSVISARRGLTKDNAIPYIFSASSETIEHFTLTRRIWANLLYEAHLLTLRLRYKS